MIYVVNEADVDDCCKVVEYDNIVLSTVVGRVLGPPCKYVDNGAMYITSYCSFCLEFTPLKD